VREVGGRAHFCERDAVGQAAGVAAQSQVAKQRTGARNGHRGHRDREHQHDEQLDQ
jgi:hypothetical protein